MEREREDPGNFEHGSLPWNFKKKDERHYIIYIYIVYIYIYFIYNTYFYIIYIS